MTTAAPPVPSMNGWRGWGRGLAIAAVYLGGWYALDFVGRQFNVAPGVSVWRPAFPLGFVLMFVFGLRYWFLLLFATRAFMLIGDVASPLLVLYDVMTVVPMTAGSLILLRLVRINPRLRTLRDVGWFVAVAAFGVPLIVAAAQVGILAWGGVVPWSEAAERALHSWAGDATGTGMLGPTLLLLLRRWPTLWATPETDPPGPLPPPPGSHHRLVGAAEICALALALGITYGISPQGSIDYTYLLFLPLLVIAVRHGFERTVAAIVALNVGAAALVKADGAPLDSFALQFGLMAMTLSGLLLGAFISDRRRSRQELEASYDATIEGWSRALALRDGETSDHTQRVADWTVRLVRAHGASEEELVQVRRGALLHDIGKMGVPDAILRKPGPLTDEEWAIMRRHPTAARDLLARIEHLQPALAIPYCHHEWWDGTGYPLGLRGEEIPLAARLFAVVDTWDALSSDRPYRAKWPPVRVLAQLRAEAGSHLDPDAVRLFLELLDRAPSNHDRTNATGKRLPA